MVFCVLKKKIYTSDYYYVSSKLRTKNRVVVLLLMDGLTLRKYQKHTRVA